MATIAPMTASVPDSRACAKNGQMVNSSAPVTPISRRATRCAFGASISRFVAMVTRSSPQVAALLRAGRGHAAAQREDDVARVRALGFDFPAVEFNEFGDVLLDVRRGDAIFRELNHARAMRTR